MNILGKILRFLTLGVIICCGVRVYLQTSQFVYDLLDFQISGYKLLLSAQDHINSVEDIGSDLMGNILGAFGGEEGSQGIDSGTDQDEFTDIQTKISTFSKKLLRISRGVGGIVGFFVSKILFDIVFGMRILLTKLGGFLS